MWLWFEAFVVCGEVDIILPFHVIVRLLFCFLEDYIFGAKSYSYEGAIRQYLVSDKFEELYTVDLPAPLTENRLAALHLFDAVLQVCFYLRASGDPPCKIPQTRRIPSTVVSLLRRNRTWPQK